MLTTPRIAAVLAATMLFCAAPASADEGDYIDAMAADLKAAGVSTTFQLGVTVGSMCVVHSMGAKDTEILAAVRKDYDEHVAQAVLATVKKHCNV
jgi:hypothetical protein